MSNVFPRNSKLSLPTAVRGDGVYLYDEAGKAYLDGSGGAAVSSLGHSDSHVTGAIKAQLDKVGFAHSGFFTTDPAEQLAERLATESGLNRVFQVSGGSEAIEAAIKLARQHALEKGEPERTRIIARRQSYHGNTLGALAAGGNKWRRAPYEPLLTEVTHVAPCYAYRDQGQANPVAYVARLIAEIDNEIQRLGPETVLAFVVEPIVGATMGAVPALPIYFKSLRDLCDRYGILLILDEVMCGMGRCGTMFAYKREKIHPDIVAVAKGLGAGYQPIGAMLCSAKVYNVIANGSGKFQHGHTYQAHPVAAAGALAVMDRLDELVPNVTPLGKALDNALRQQFGEHPHVGDIRGRGLFRGLELVQDRTTKDPFDPERQIHARVKQACFDAGLLCYPMGGTIDGKRGDHILLAPPFIISRDQIGELVDKLAKGLKAALAS